MGRISQQGLPQHVVTRTGRSGRTYYYFSRPTHRTKKRNLIPLGPQKEAALSSYRKLLNELPKSDRARALKGWSAVDVWRAARARARRRGMTFDLSLDDVTHMQERAKGRCEVTGIRFDMRAGNWRRRPWAPSIDRIDSQAPYSSQNCRLVCSAVNIALNEFGDAVFDEIVRGYVRMKYRRRV